MMLFLERARPASGGPALVFAILAMSVMVATAAFGVAVYSASQPALCEVRHG